MNDVLCVPCVVFQRMQCDNYAPTMFTVCCVSTNAGRQLCPKYVCSVLCFNKCSVTSMSQLCLQCVVIIRANPLDLMV